MPLLIRLLVASSAVCTPVWAQTPLFSDGPAFGGSQVFSEGQNPLGNPARTAQAPAGYYLTYVGGDQRAPDNKSILANTASADPGTVSGALGQLAGAPWAQRTKGYGLAAVKNSMNLALTREELNGLLATTDLAPGDLGAGLAGNNSSLLGTRAVVNRLSLGGGGPVQTGFAGGFSVRVEDWSMGQQAQPYNTFGQPGFGNAEGLLGATGTSNRTWLVGLDGGLTYDLAQGIRLGATVTQLNPKSLWGIDLRPQFRGGLQLDLGAQTKLSLEGDMNAVEKMPFPVKQQSTSASLRFAINPSAVLVLGVEQRKIDGVSATRGGATLQLRTQSLLLCFGFQADQDNPMKSATVGFL